MNIGKTELKEAMIKTNKEVYQCLLEKGNEVKLEQFPAGHDYLYWNEGIIKGLQYLQ